MQESLASFNVASFLIESKILPIDSSQFMLGLLIHARFVNSSSIDSSLKQKPLSLLLRKGGLFSFYVFLRELGVLFVLSV